jgi:hypothetical protein
MKVRAIAEEVRQVMAANAKIVDPHLDWSEQVKSIRLEVDQDRARALGLTPQDVAQTLQTLLSGYTVTQYREGIEHIDVVARAVASERLELNRLPALTITSRNGVAVPQLELPLGLEDEKRRPGTKRGIARWTADRAVDKIRDRFGWEAVEYGSTLGLSLSVPDEFRELAEKDL